MTSLGAHRVHTVDAHDEPLPLGAFDVVLDTVGGPAVRESVALARRGGTYITLQGPAPSDRLADLGVTGTFFIVTPSREGLGELGAEVDTGRLRVTIASTFPLVDGRSAFESGSLPGRAPGKTVLVVKEPSRSPSPTRTSSP